MSIFSFFNQPEPGTGALPDIRSEEEKLTDIKFEELVTSADSVNWVEKKTWRSFPEFNQGSSGSCVAQTLAKMLGILYWLKNNEYVHFSATHIYQRRSNKPSAGMIGVNAFDIAGQGVTLEVLVPSQKLTDGQMDATKIAKYKEEVGEVFKTGKPVILRSGDFDTVASTIQKTGKGVMVWFYFTSAEWGKEVPEILTNLNGASDARSLRHSVTAVDAGLRNGKEVIKIEDSAHFGKRSVRYITREFFEKRNFFSAYTMNFKFDTESPATNRPKVPVFNTTLEFSPTFKVVEAVKNLQDILKFEGLFPQNVESTGYYGAVTAEAVLKFQKKYQLGTNEELNRLNGRRAGSRTIQKLNELYT